MTVEQIWKAIENGTEVNWTNDLYYVHKVEAKESNEFAKPTYKNGYALRITCKENYFGSLAHEDELDECYISEDNL